MQLIISWAKDYGRDLSLKEEPTGPDRLKMRSI
jgi:hypothetical protein